MIVFLALITFPFWFTLASGKAGYRPNPELPEGKCVEAKAYMKAWHMDLLNEWRDAVVRDGQRIYIPKQEVSCSQDHECTGGSCVSGKCRYEMSLSNTCMKCHVSRDKFCNQCHNYIGVSPYCWDCHVEPKGE